MIKGTKVQFTNTYGDIGTGTTMYNMYAIPSGKTFVLTDLVLAMTSGANLLLSGVSSPLLKLFDFNSNASAVSVAGNVCRLMVQSDLQGSNPTYTPLGKIMHFENGPEFTTGITPEMSNAQIVPTNGLWLAGVLR